MSISLACPLCEATIEVDVSYHGRHRRAHWDEWTGGSPEEWPEVVVSEIACPEGCVLSDDRIRALEASAEEIAANELDDARGWDREWDDD